MERTKAKIRIFSSLKRLKDKELQNIARLNKNSFIRKRKMPLEDMLRYGIFKKGKVLSMDLYEYFKESDNLENRVTPSAYCQQRTKINPEVFRVLNADYVKSIYESNSYKTYKGYKIFAVDSTAAELPKEKDLVKEFGKTWNQQGEESQPPRATVSGLYDVENGIMVDAIIDQYKINNMNIVKQNIENLKKVMNLKKIIIIFDRGYVSMDIILYLEELGIKYIVRLDSRKFTKEQSSMQTDDEVITIKFSKSRFKGIKEKAILEKYKKAKSVKIRFVRVYLDNEVEYLITNLTSSEIKYEEMKDMYFKRWQIEIAYDIWKNKLEIENFTGKSKIVIEQDFYSHVYLFNMAQDLKNEVNDKLVVKKAGLKYTYKVNTRILIGILRNRIIEVLSNEEYDRSEELYKEMLNEMERNLVPIRPNRKNPRNFYKGRNKYKQNKKFI